MNWLMRLICSPAGYQLWLALNRHKEWEIRHYTIHHTSGMSFWIANGSFFFNGSGCTNKCIGLFERNLIYLRAKSLINRNVAASLMGVA